MTFHGQSVISLVWGVVSTDSPRGLSNSRPWIGSSFLRRAASEALRVVSRRAVAVNPTIGPPKQQ
jgi:hypothetical protein